MLGQSFSSHSNQHFDITVITFAEYVNSYQSMIMLELGWNQ